MLGEELGRFRDASKALYKFLEAFTWSGKVERLGFDEVFMDVTDIIDYNLGLLNHNASEESFFQLNRKDPTVGFAFDATRLAGHGYPENSALKSSGLKPQDDPLMARLILGAHLAQHLRRSLEEEMGYTSTVGISTNKLLSKLVGNLNKPKGQTTLLPPYIILDLPVDINSGPTPESNVTVFLDSHEVGKIPGIGFKMSNLIRRYILSRPAAFDEGLIYGETKEHVTVRDVRAFPDMSPALLETLLRGIGSEKGIGVKVWNLLHGIDPTEVQHAKNVPSQISIEDSYIRLDTMPQVLKELRALTTTLIKRMHKDLLEDVVDDDDTHNSHDFDGQAHPPSKRWIAHPKILRLSTRPRPPKTANGEAPPRTFNRISRSCALPNLVFNIRDSIDAIVERLVAESLLPMFKKLHPRTIAGGWDLSLLNVCVTGMVEAAREEGGKGGGTGSGRDIGRMFRRQESVLREWRMEDRDVPPDSVTNDDIDLRRDGVGTVNLGMSMGRGGTGTAGDRAEPSAGYDASYALETELVDLEEKAGEAMWEGHAENYAKHDDDDSEEEEVEPDARSGNSQLCGSCGAIMPSFAMAAHERYHVLGEQG